VAGAFDKPLLDHCCSGRVIMQGAAVSQTAWNLAALNLRPQRLALSGLNHNRVTIERVNSGITVAMKDDGGDKSPKSLGDRGDLAESGKEPPATHRS
jgi:hypothetical protein